MAQLNDCKFDALRAQGYSGAIDDMEDDWGNDNNLPGGTTGTPWYNALINSGILPACINDMEFEFWCNQGGSFGLKPLFGWTDGVNCDGSGFYSVIYNTEVTFDDHSDVFFIKNAALRPKLNFNNDGFINIPINISPTVAGRIEASANVTDASILRSVIDDLLGDFRILSY